MVNQAGTEQADRVWGRWDLERLMEMEAPLQLLVGAVWLLEDIARSCRADLALRPEGLMFLSEAMAQHAELFYELYYCHTPEKSPETV